MTLATKTVDDTVSRQWASRPRDERHLNLHAMGAMMHHVRNTSCAKVVSSRSIAFQPDPADPVKGLQVVGSAGVPFAPTHWATGQLASLAGAPAGYLRSLPAPIAADCLNYGFKFGRDVADVGLLLQKNGGPGFVKAATGPKYGRVWNADIVDHLIDNYGDGVTGQFRVPGEFGKRVPITEQNTTLYASDRDMFVFLADEENRITLPGRRDGKSGSLARGFYVSNSEVGAGTLTVAMYLFDYVCQNRIIWGIQDFKKVAIRHSAGAPDRYIEEARPVIEAMSQASAKPIEDMLQAAQAARVETDLDAFLKAKRFTTAEVTGMKAAFLADEGRPLEDGKATLWDITTAATAYARDIGWQNTRVDLESRSGALLDLVAVPA